MLQCGRELYLASESVDADRGSHLRRQNLDYDLCLEVRVFGEEHAGHASATEFPLDAVGIAERLLDLVAQVTH